MYILFLRARRFFEVVLVSQPREVALVTRMADVYQHRGACRTWYFCKITQNFTIFQVL